MKFRVVCGQYTIMTSQRLPQPSTVPSTTDHHCTGSPLELMNLPVSFGVRPATTFSTFSTPTEAGVGAVRPPNSVHMTQSTGISDHNKAHTAARRTCLEVSWAQRNDGEVWSRLRLLGRLRSVEDTESTTDAQYVWCAVGGTGTHQHVEPGFGDSVGQGLCSPHCPNAANDARDVYDRLLSALLDEREECLRDERGPEEVRLERLREARRVELERVVVPTRILSVSMSMSAGIQVNPSSVYSRKRAEGSRD